MGSRTKTQTKAARILVGFVLLAMVGYADFITGYELTLFLFYLLPILYVLRHAGLGSAFVMALISSVVCLFVNIAAGQHYSDLLTPIWNTSTRLAVFLLVVILFSNRDHLKKLVEQRTESLRLEIQERSRLQKELLEIAEAEQRRIGQDLHDSLGQHLTATALAGKVLAKRLANKSTVEPAMADRMVAMVEEAIELTRNLAHSLHPVEMEADGLGDALLNLATNLSTAFNVSCRLQHSGAVVLNDPRVGVHLYRIAQEAASNAIRHGRARNVVISLDATSKSIMLSVTDDGTGLPADARTKKGMGLRIMDYRADMIGATFDIQNLPAGGARAVCVLPFRLTDAEYYANED
jgi:signal transduction histidine kinase